MTTLFVTPDVMGEMCPVEEPLYPHVGSRDLLCWDPCICRGAFQAGYLRRWDERLTILERVTANQHCYR